jgi:beta-glucosidase-like glycosyl hydrolase
VAAGADVALVCHDPEAQRAALEGLRRAVGEGHIPMPQLSASLARIAAFKEMFAVQAEGSQVLKLIGSREHRRIAKALVSNKH